MPITVAPCQEIHRIRSMDELRELLPTPDDVNEMNFALFSTSGIHGSYLTIEHVEEALHAGADLESEEDCKLTVLVVQPRCVTTFFGHIPVEIEDIPYLKALREASWRVVPSIGKRHS